MIDLMEERFDLRDHRLDRPARRERHRRAVAEAHDEIGPYLRFADQ
jgi:hypothetical protein